MSELSSYERARVMFPDQYGLARGKYLPGHLADRGTGHCATTWGLGYDRSMIPAPGSYLLEGLIDVHAVADPATVRPGWEDDRTAVAVADVSLNGEPFEYSARYVLQQAIKRWTDAGFTPKVGLELEAYLLEPVDDGAALGSGGWTRYRNPRAMVYGTGVSSDPSGVIDEVMATAAGSGFRLESVNAEFDESQYELTLEYDDALIAADDAFLFRVMAREVAIAKGLDLTFVGKPFAQMSGSGVHVNFSIVDGDGNNAFADPSADDGLSTLATSAIAGLITHHRSLIGVGAPTVNAYRRLIPGELAGYWANWGYDHRAVATRVPAARGPATRIESRVLDGAVNIHLGVAAVLTAAWLGVDNEIECPPPETSDGLETINTDVGAPDNLAEGLDALEADIGFADALGRAAVDNLVANKRAEWERFTAAEGEFVRDDPPTEWELNEYLRYH